MTTSLVAVSHELTEGESDKLMSPEVQGRFTREVLLNLTNRSLILSEGLRYKELIDPEHRNYDFIRTYFFGDALGSLRPTFGGFDPRSTLSTEEADLIAQMYDAWEKIAKNLVLIDLRKLTIPDSLAGIIAIVRQGGPHVELKRPPTEQEVRIAQLMTGFNRDFDRAYLQAIKTHASKYDHCLFVGGGTHVVSMALKSKHQIIDLVPDVEIPRVLFASLSDRWTRLFTNAAR